MHEFDIEFDKTRSIEIESNRGNLSTSAILKTSSLEFGKHVKGLRHTH